MSNGFLFYCYNNEHVLYSDIANINAMLIKKHMKHNNISVVTDEITGNMLDRSLFDQIIIKSPTQINRRTFVYPDHKETVTWKNTTRDTAYELSPYDKTILLDVDYLIFNNSHDILFDTTHGYFNCYSSALDVVNGTHMNPMVGKIPMLWATMIYFEKCPIAEQHFSYMEYIRENYVYFAKLYGFTIRQFRNDYSLTIAHKELRNWTDCTPCNLGRINTFGLDAKILDIKNDGTIIFELNNTESAVGMHKYSNAHIMNKHIILEYGEQLKHYAKT